MRSLRKFRVNLYRRTPLNCRSYGPLVRDIQRVIIFKTYYLVHTRNRLSAVYTLPFESQKLISKISYSSKSVEYPTRISRSFMSENLPFKPSTKNTHCIPLNKVSSDQQCIGTRTDSSALTLWLLPTCVAVLHAVT